MVEISIADLPKILNINNDDGVIYPIFPSISSLTRATRERVMDAYFENRIFQLVMSHGASDETRIEAILDQWLSSISPAHRTLIERVQFFRPTYALRVIYRGRPRIANTFTVARILFDVCGKYTWHIPALSLACPKRTADSSVATEPMELLIYEVPESPPGYAGYGTWRIERV